MVEMLPACRLCLEPRLAQAFVISRSFVPRQKRLPNQWWLRFSPEEYGRKKYEEYVAREDSRVRNLQKKVEKFRATRGYSLDADAIEEYRSEHENIDVPSVTNKHSRKKNWIPPPDILPDEYGYIVKRSHLGNLPVYVSLRKHPFSYIIKIKHCDGDLWKLKSDLETELSLTEVHVNEITGGIFIFSEWERKDERTLQVEEFLYRKGF